MASDNQKDSPRSYDGHEEWIISAKKALNWFIHKMGVDEWSRRRAGVVEYFNSIPGLKKSIDGFKPDKPFYRYAGYEDWMAWYMYLVESLVDRPACDEPMQSARIYPFFAAIGRQIEQIKTIEGIEARISSLLNERKNQPDSTLFELVVALAYCRNGWKVRFIPETPGDAKQPDFEITRSDTHLLVECKRLAKATDYAETERLEWNKRWKCLFAAMEGFGTSVHADITFKIPVEELPVDGLIDIFVNYVKDGHLAAGTLIETREVKFAAKPIDMQRVANHFAKNFVRHNSPQLIALLADGYLPYGNYTHAFEPSEICVIGEDDGLHVLNEFVGGIRRAYSTKWECIADESIEKKAKDIRTTLSRAVKQIPYNNPGVIHIGYETLDGPLIEFRRYEKIKETMGTFDFLDKKIEGVFFHALQTMAKIEDFEFAETTTYFGNLDPDEILPDRLLATANGTNAKQSTHWQEDAENLNMVAR